MRVRVGKVISALPRICLPSLALPAAYIAATFSLFWTPMDNLARQLGISFAGMPRFLEENAETFTRQIGQALVYGIDIDKRITNMIFYGFLYLPLLFLLCWGLLGLLFRGRKIEKEGLSFLTRLTAAAFPALAITMVSRLNASIFSLFSPIACLAVIMVVGYLRFMVKWLTLQQFKWAFFSALSLEFFGIRLVYGMDGTLADSFLQSMAASLVVYLVILLLLCRLGMRFAKSPRCDSLCAALTPLYAAPILVSLFLELCNILNQYEIFITHKLSFSIGIALGCALLGMVWFVLFGRKKTPGTVDYTKWQYIFLILSMAALFYQPAVQMVAGTELFESSNAGSDVYAFLTAGELPLIENLNVHMVLEEIGALLYGVLNRDPLGAIWFHYPILPIAQYLLLYCFFVQMTDRENGVLMTLFFPAGALFSLLPYATIGLLPIIAAIQVVRKKEKRSIVLFVLSCVLLCLYRADIGLACGGASMLALTIWFLAQKDRKSFQTLWITTLCTGLACGGGFVLLCLLRGVSPMARMLEAVSILQANINWAYRSVANQFDFTFFFCYLLVPAGVFIGTAFLLLRRKQKHIPDALCLFSIMLALSQLFLFSRGIIRHNLTEGSAAFAIGFGVLCILVTLWTLHGFEPVRLPWFLSGILFCQLWVGGDLFQGSTLLQDSLNRQLQTEPYQEILEKVDRVVIPNELHQIYQPLKILFDATLMPEQTYFDYSYDTILYALLDRDKPVYTNQSPSQLNAEFDQLLFIRELEQANCPYAISRIGEAGWDGIDLDINHYLVAEYLYKNYRPLCRISHYFLWVKKEEYTARRAEIQALADVEAITVDIIEETDASLVKTYDLGQVPWLWGAYDKANQQEVLQKLSEAPDDRWYGTRIRQTETPGVFTYALQKAQLTQNGTNLRVAVWCSDVGGQEDLIWYPLNDLDGTYSTTIAVGNHMGQTGEYQFHTYYDDTAGTPQLYSATSVTIPANLSIVERPEIHYYYDLTPASLERSDGNYLEIIAAAEKADNVTAELLDQAGNILCTMHFNLQPGENRYLLRISSNFMWYTEIVSQLRLTFHEAVSGLSVNVLRGDVNYDSMNALQRQVLAGEPRLRARTSGKDK